MNKHLEEAKDYMARGEQDNALMEYAELAKTHALIAIAEQLEKMNYKGHHCSSCHTEPVEYKGYLCDDCLVREECLHHYVARINGNFCEFCGKEGK